MYWDRYIHRNNPRRIEPLDKPLDMYVMLDTETTGLHPEEGATLIEIGAFLVQPGNENSRPKFEQLIDPRQPLSEFITGLTGITDQMLQGMPTAGAAMLRFHQWLDQVWPTGEPLTIIAHNAEFDVSFLDAAERVYDPTASGFDCRWLCTKEMSWELNPQKRHHRVTDLIADYHIGDTEEHRALADAIQEQMIYRALCHEATMRGKWIGQLASCWTRRRHTRTAATMTAARLSKEPAPSATRSTKPTAPDAKRHPLTPKSRRPQSI